MPTNENATATGGSRVRSHVRAADLILTEADKHGLRLPYIQRADEHGLHFGFRTLDEVTEWAIWSEAVIEATVEPSGVHHVAEGVLFDQPVRIWALVPLPLCRCGHASEGHRPVVGCDFFVGHGGTCRCSSYNPARVAVPA